MPFPYNAKPKQPSVEGNRPRQTVETSTDFTISLKRTGHAVQITLTATDDYSAIELFDSLVTSIEDGRGITLGAALSANTRPSTR